MTDPISLQDIAAIIASVPKGADKGTLTAAIDKAVDGVISNLQAAGGTLPPDLLKTTKFTLEFLEACGKMGDPDFRAHIKTRASELHNELSMAAAKAAAAAPPSAADPNAKTYSSFEPAFSDYFCEFLGLRLRAFQIDADPPPFAYVLNKNFEKVFLDAVRSQVLPEILKGRRIRTMADSVAVGDLTRNFFFEEFLKDPSENPTHMLWTGLMDDFRTALAPPPAPPKDKKGKGGGLAAMFSKKPLPAPPKKTTTGDRFAMAEKFLKTLQKGAQDNGFDPPRVEDFRFFRALIDYKMGDIETNKKALGQLLVQENLEDEEVKAREGATRDWLYRIVERLPPHCGELLALWAYYTHGELFSQQMLRSFMMGQGTTEKARERAVPMFSRWMKDVIDMAKAQPTAAEG
jgi:hypothetical protein